MSEVPEEGHLEIYVPPEVSGGVYANFAVVNHSPYEFTIDFVSVDFAAGGSRGTLVSRLKMSPAFLRELADTLDENWKLWAEKAAPSEGS